MMWQAKVLVHSCLVCALIVRPHAALAQDMLELEPSPYSLDPNKACGPLCLAFLERYLGGSRTYAEVAGRCSPGAQGTTLRDLQRSASELGYSTLAFQASPEQLKRLPGPAILHLRGQTGNTHFVVLLNWDERTELFRLFDPPWTVADREERLLVSTFTGVGMLVGTKPLPPLRSALGPSPYPPFWLVMGLCLLDGLFVVGVGWRFLPGVLRRSAVVCMKVAHRGQPC